MTDICLLSMPFGALTRPSLALGLLVASAKREGLDIKSYYPAFSFAKEIGINSYFLISSYSKPINSLGEWIFSKAAFPEFKTDDKKYLENVINVNDENEKFVLVFNFYSDNRDISEKLYEIREKASNFIEKTAKKVLSENPKIVACSSLFFQNCSSLALLRRIKELNPSIVTILGGGNCEAEMGVILKKNFKWVDFLMSGEGDYAFPQLCKLILKNGKNIKKEELPTGVFSEQNIDYFYKNISLAPVSVVTDLNNLPFPDYDDYFEELEYYGIKDYIIPGLLVEGSRGCWKGYKNPCSFCGLNGERKIYRSKSSERLLKEYDYLYEKYNIDKFFMTDTILNMKFFDNLLSELEKRETKYSIFFETISRLKEHEIKRLANAGIRWIQPGIENLNDEFLKQINKGNRAIENVALLKFLKENGVKSSWNMLLSTPYHEKKWYSELLSLVPLLEHLEPPNFSMIRYDRFSLYHKNPEKYNIKLKPAKSYYYIYPFNEEDLNKFVYFFSWKDSKKNIDNVKPEIDELEDILKKWAIKREKLPKLEIYEEEEKSLIYDTRNCTDFNKIILSSLTNKIYKICRFPVNKEKIKEKLKNIYNIDIDNAKLENTLKKLQEKKLLIFLSGKYLALATYKPIREFLTKEEFPGGNVKTLIIEPEKILKKTNEMWDWFSKIEN